MYQSYENRGCRCNSCSSFKKFSPGKSLVGNESRNFISKPNYKDVTAITIQLDVNHLLKIKLSNLTEFQ